MARQLCTFQVAGQTFGLPVEQVQEVIRDQPITRIPLSPGAVSGLINLRGQIVPILDLRGCLELPPPAQSEAANVVLATEAGPVSLRVDEIGDVLSVSDESFEPSPEHLTGVMRRLVLGVYKLEGSLLLLISTDVVIDMAVSTPAPGTGAGLSLMS